jgi:hypothetical protein
MDKIMKTIVITSDKGGVGKSTLAALIIEWLNFNNVLVDLVDADPIQTTRTWSDNCASDGRIVLSKTPEYLIVDTDGTSGAGLTWLQKGDIIIIISYGIIDFEEAKTFKPALVFPNENDNSLT